MFRRYVLALLSLIALLPGSSKATFLDSYRYAAVPAGPIEAAPGGGNWSSPSTWVGGVVPTATDDVLLTAASGNVTIDGTIGSPSLCRSLDATGYTGTLTQAASTGLSISGSLTLVAGMTYAPNQISRVSFTSTTTGNTITTAGKTFGSVYFDGIGGEWNFQSSFLTTTNTSPSVRLVAGTINTNGNAMTMGGFEATNTTNVRGLNLGASVITINQVWNILNATNMTLNAGTSAITISNATTTFTGGGFTYNNVTLTGNGVTTINGANTFANLTRTGGATKASALILAANQTVTGNLVLNGNSAVNRIYVASDVTGTARTLTAGTVSATHADFEDITGAGAGNWNLASITGNSGDCGGNTNLTFTGLQVNYWKSSVTDNYSTTAKWFLGSNGTGGAGRVPLCQDRAIFDASSFGGATSVVNFDMPRYGWMSWAAATTGTMNRAVASSHYNNLALSSSMTLGSTGSFAVTWKARFASSLTMAGKNFGTPFIMGTGGSTLTLQDALAASTLTVNSGTLALNGQTVTSAGAIAVNDGVISGSTGTITGTTYTQTGTSALSSSASVGTLTLSGAFIQNGGTYTAGAGGVATTTVTVGNLATSVVNMGSGTWGLSGTGNFWVIGAAATLNAQTSTINNLDTSGTAKTFAGGNRTYNNLYINGAISAGTVTITASNTFNVLTLEPNSNIRFTAGTNTTLTGTPSCTGASGNPIVWNSPTAANHTITKTSGTVACSYMTLTRSTATGGATFTSTSSTNGGNNSGWTISP